MTTTRERLRALADDPTFTAGGRGRSHPDVAEAVALAAYRMAIEDAAAAIDTLAAMGPHDEASGWAMACADAVRALADEVSE